MLSTIEIPFRPRSYQLELYDALGKREIRRAVCVWHRRAGKDVGAFNWEVMQALQVPGVYFYVFPTKVQGRRILWNGIDLSGKRLLSYVPKEALIGEPNDAEMRLRVRSGRDESLIQVIGTDDPDTIVGPNPIGVVFSEFSLQNPVAWDLVRPILAENGGWAVFLFTPRGKNHAYRLFKTAESLPDEWYTTIKTVEHTRRDSPGEDGSYVISPADIESERRSGMPEELIQQEFYCSFEGEVSGSYYAGLMDMAEREKRIGNFPWEPKVPVDTAWDIGFGRDQAAVVFFQVIDNEVVFIDYLEARHKSLVDWAKILRDKPYVYGTHVWPHDIRVHEFVSGDTRYEVATRLIPGKHRVAKKIPVEEGIDLVRRLFYRFKFDRTKCVRLIHALTEYRQDWDEEKQVFSKKPVHDWTSHPADAVRTMAIGYPWRSYAEHLARRQIRAITKFDPMSESGPIYEHEFDAFAD